jgi:EVE domain-containing protein
VPRHWIGVVSREHVARGVAGGFAQLGHGKHAPLRRLMRGDWLVYYSPRTAYPDGEPVRAFTAIGQVADEEATRVSVTEDFAPWRRRVRYEPAREVPAADLLRVLDVVPDPRRWGLLVRRGLVEIGRPDFERIAEAMLGRVPPDA